MSLRDKIEQAFNNSSQMQVTENIDTDSDINTEIDLDFSQDAIDIVKEAQRKTANTGMSRGKYRDDMVHDVSHSKTVKEHFSNNLSEALDGLATADGKQPMDLFKTFARALRVLGERMGVGPLQNKLKEKGITWKKSSDGQDLILVIKNADTKTEQPVARINYETLQNPNDFQEQLKNMLDFAMGQAPGAFSQQEKEIQDRKKTISDIAKAIKPMDQESEVAKQMNINMNTDKETMVAQTAATPKVSLN